MSETANDHAHRDSGNRVTAGEQLFQEYLESRQIRFVREEPHTPGVSRPDFRLLIGSGVLVELKDFEETERDRAFREAGSAGMGIDPYTRIRDKIHEAKAQFRDHKASGRPCVLALHNAGAVLVDLRSELIAGAMHGNLGFSIQIGDVAIEPRTHFDARTARLRENLNTTISAVAVIERFRPNDSVMQAEIARRVNPAEGDIATTLRLVTEAMEAIVREMADIDFDLSVPRVRVVHNPHARVRLPADVFNGPHDQQFLPDLRSL